METTITQSKLDTLDVQSLFDRQRSNSRRISQSTARERIRKLKALQRNVLTHKQEIRDALYNDFKKNPSEVDLTEIYPVTGAIKFAVANLRKWMRDERVGTPLALLGTSSWIHKEAKGVVLIISPWNFPVNLTFGPLVSAIAAGNCVILKPSEHTPNASAVMKKIISKVFDEDEIALVEGGIDAAKSLLAMPFNHIFFTGAPSVGKEIMKAAAVHLASITLELGGKSPTIVDETADLKKAASRIAWSKCMNNGQICIAPDYVYLHESKVAKFIEEINSSIREMYGEDISTSESYCRIVNDRHFKRLKGYMDHTMTKDQAVLVKGGKMNPEDDFIEPTLLTNVDDESDFMLNEIFGPFLPIYSYSKLDEVVDRINEKEKPLALYIYSKSKKNQKFILDNTSAGGTCINHSSIHFFNNHLPFGGVNNSGIGKAHGKFGFDEFSNQRGVLKQWSPISAVEMMKAPYTQAKQKLIDLSIKYF
jgi:aldehyde dehydrogenase (NAD+)